VPDAKFRSRDEIYLCHADARSARAQQLLQEDIAWSAACVHSAVTVPLDQDEFDALVDFVFNVGQGAFWQVGPCPREGGGGAASPARGGGGDV
jgi:hypothetical protein